MNDNPALEDAPQWELVSFDSAEITTDESGKRILTIRGETPHSSASGCEVQLFPAKYLVQPEYTRVEVMWNRTNAIFTSVCPYTVSVPLSNVSGSKGLDLVGANKTERLSA